MFVWSDEEFESSARQLRQQIGIDDRFTPDVIFALDQLVKGGRIARYSIKSDTEFHEDALYDSDEGLILLKRSIWDALDHPYREGKKARRYARFTVAHELGHLQRGHQGVHQRGPASVVARKIPSKVRTAEIEVGRFAAAFLIPYHLAGADHTAEDLSDLFDVNLTPAQIRLGVLQRMHRRIVGFLRPLPESVRAYLEEAQRTGVNIKSRLDD